MEHPDRGERPRRAVPIAGALRGDHGRGLVAAGRVRPAHLVRTQGRILTVADLLSTLSVEAAVHHLDLVLRLDRPGPSAEPLAEVRRVLEGLLGARCRTGGTTSPRRGGAPGGNA